jgi:delta-aminolevulinic acid dehydratase/porphobilinogen synthase
MQAKAGCDILAPSDMMDGRVGRFVQRSRPRASRT